MTINGERTQTCLHESERNNRRRQTTTVVAKPTPFRGAEVPRRRRSNHRPYRHTPRETACSPWATACRASGGGAPPRGSGQVAARDSTPRVGEGWCAETAGGGYTSLGNVEGTSV